MEKRTKRATATDLHVGAQLKKHRLIRGVSQTVIGKALGISFQQMQKYENGSNRMSASKMQAAANLLQVPVAAFFDGGPDAGGKTGAAALPWGNLLSTKEGVALCSNFAKITDDALRRLILDLVRYGARA
jgi:transcriptional regulator with XRE-family HTH domain